MAAEMSTRPRQMPSSSSDDPRVDACFAKLRELDGADAVLFLGIQKVERGSIWTGTGSQSDRGIQITRIQVHAEFALFLSEWIDPSDHLTGELFTHLVDEFLDNEGSRYKALTSNCRSVLTDASECYLQAFGPLAAESPLHMPRPLIDSGNYLVAKLADPIDVDLAFRKFIVDPKFVPIVGKQEMQAQLIAFRMARFLALNRLETHESESAIAAFAATMGLSV